MKRIFIFLICLAILILPGYFTDNGKRIAQCSMCLEQEEMAGSCPFCDAELCAWCLSVMEYEADSWRESNMEHGYEDGYNDGYDEGFYYAANLIFDHMTDEEYKRWSDENWGIEKYYEDGKSVFLP